MDLRDSWLNCPKDGKKLVIDPLDEEGQATVTHRCVSCTYAERAPGQRPQKTDSPFMASLREKVWQG